MRGLITMRVGPTMRHTYMYVHLLDVLLHVAPYCTYILVLYLDVAPRIQLQVADDMRAILAVLESSSEGVREHPLPLLLLKVKTE